MENMVLLQDETRGLCTLHPDIIETHVLTRLDGPSLASAASSSATLRHLSSSDKLWSDICCATWPSTATSPRVSQVVSSFPRGGPRAFFSHAFPLPSTASTSSSSTPPSELISAVDIHYKDELIFSKVQHTETSTGWFRCSPFRIDLLEPKEVVPTPIEMSEGEEDTCADIRNHMRLSWILVDPVGRRAANLSSRLPVSVHRHWLTGEVRARFATILPGHVQCGIVVTCGGSEGSPREMQVREVSVEMEDMDGANLSGKDSLVILHCALESKKGSRRKKVEEGRRRYIEYVEMKRERRERKLRTEGTLDVLCVGFGISVFVAFLVLFLAR